MASLSPAPDGLVPRHRRLKPERKFPVMLEKNSNNARLRAHPFQTVLVVQTLKAQTVPAQDAGGRKVRVAEIKISRDGKVVESVPFPAHYDCENEPYDDGDDARCTYYVELRELYRKDLPHGALLEVTVKLEGDVTDYLWSTRVKRPWSLYRIGGSRVPLWIPAGLFGSNFQQLSPGGGVPFAVLPAGVAFGFKYHFRENTYVGLSALGLYTILPTTQVEATTAVAYPGGSIDFEPSPTSGGGSVTFPQQDATDKQRRTSISLLSLTIGGLIDAGGFVLLGGGAAWDYTKPKPSGRARKPTGLFIIGIGPELLRILQGGGK